PRGEEAMPTAQALAALLRVGHVARVGVGDIVLLLVLAAGGAAAGRALRGRVAALLGAMIGILSLIVTFVLAGRGSPVLIVAPLVAIALATGMTAVASIVDLNARRA